MSRKLSIIKNGYDVIRITEMGPGEFKISNTSGNNNIDVFAQSLFHNPEYIDFDKSIKWEFSYHAATLSKNPKIHMKKADIKDQQKSKDDYLTLPLENLIDPDIYTEIPIPLFRIYVPDGCLKNKYKNKIDGDKEHRVIDIGDNNSIDIFMTSSDYQKEYLSKKWENLNRLLLMNDIRYYATNSKKYIGLNFCNNFSSMEKHSVKTVATGVTVTNNIGMLVHFTKNLNFKANKLTFLFIDNSEYLTFLALPEMCVGSKKQKVYKYDFENENFFNDEERKKWEYQFGKLEKKTKFKIKRYRKRFII